MIRKFFGLISRIYWSPKFVDAIFGAGDGEDYDYEYQ